MLSVVRLSQCFSTFVRPRSGRFFFHKTWARSEFFDTFTNIFLLRIFPLKNIYSWKLLRKLKWQIPGEPLAARYNWCQGPVPGRGPAVEKRWSKRHDRACGGRRWQDTGENRVTNSLIICSGEINVKEGETDIAYSTRERLDMRKKFWLGCEKRGHSREASGVDGSSLVTVVCGVDSCGSGWGSAWR